MATERPAPACQAAGQCMGPNAYFAVCDCYDAIWEGEKWWETIPASPVSDAVLVPQETKGDSDASTP